MLDHHTITSNTDLCYTFNLVTDTVIVDSGFNITLSITVALV
jgi:hypothetical protein